MLLNEIISKEQFEKGSKYRKEVNRSYSGKEHLKSLPALRDIMKNLSPDGRFHRTLVFDYETLRSQFEDADNTGISVVMKFLQELGYTVTPESYQLNLAYKNNKQYTFKEIFNNLEGQLKTMQKNVVDPIDKHKTGSKILDDKVLKSLKKKQQLLNKYQTKIMRFVRKEKTDSGLKIVISILPRVIASQSTEVAWKSCQNLNGGSYREYVGSGISAGVLIAFLVKKDDLEMDNPLGRTLIKPFENENGDVFWYVDKAYGAEKSFRETLVELFDSFNVRLEYGNYKLKKDIYNDGINNIEFDENYVNRKLIDKFFDHVLQGDVDGVKLSIKNGVDPSVGDNQAIKLASEDGHIKVIKLLLKDPRVDPSDDDNYATTWAARKGHAEVVKLLLKDSRVDPSDVDNYAIRWASRNGHTEIVKLLLKDPRVDPSDDDNRAIIWASEKDHVEIVELLLNDKRVDPSNGDNYAIRWASENGRVEIAKLLLKDPRVDPSTVDNHAIRWASRNGHTEVVKLLLKDKKVDPSALINYAIRWATVNGHADVVKLLLEDPRVRDTLDKETKIQIRKLLNHAPQ